MPRALLLLALAARTSRPPRARAMRYAIVAIVIAACTDGPPVTTPDPIVQTHVDTYELYGQFPRTVDVMFVIGDLGGRDVSSIATTVEDLLPTWFDGFTNVRIATTSSPDVLEISTDILGQPRELRSTAPSAPGATTGSSSHV